MSRYDYHQTGALIGDAIVARFSPEGGAAMGRLAEGVGCYSVVGRSKGTPAVAFAIRERTNGSVRALTAPFRYRAGYSHQHYRDRVVPRGGRALTKRARSPSPCGRANSLATPLAAISVVRPAAAHPGYGPAGTEHSHCNARRFAWTRARAAHSTVSEH